MVVGHCGFGVETCQDGNVRWVVFQALLVAFLHGGWAGPTTVTQRSTQLGELRALSDLGIAGRVKTAN